MALMTTATGKLMKALNLLSTAMQMETDSATMASPRWHVQLLRVLSRTIRIAMMAMLPYILTRRKFAIASITIAMALLMTAPSSLFTVMPTEMDLAIRLYPR